MENSSENGSRASFANDKLKIVNLTFAEHRIKMAFVCVEQWKENLWVVLREVKISQGKVACTPSLSSNTHQSKQTASLHEQTGETEN